MLKSECYKGRIVHFTCDGRGRGGHYHVTAKVVEVKRKNALLVEQPRSYSPGTRWLWPIEKLRTDEQERVHGQRMVQQVIGLWSGELSIADVK